MSYCTIPIYLIAERNTAQLTGKRITALNQAVSGTAPWRSGKSIPEDEDNEQGPVYLGELEKMLDTLVKLSRNEEVTAEAEHLLQRIKDYFPEGKITADCSCDR